VFLVDGVVCGVWERREHGGRVEIGVESAVKLTAAQRRSVEGEGDRIGRFFGREVGVSLT
jgi:hypothetical protein